MMEKAWAMTEKNMGSKINLANQRAQEKLRRERLYESATKELVGIVDTMDFPSRYDNMRIKNLILRFRDAYKLPLAQLAISRHLKKADRGRFSYPSRGFCKTTKVLYMLSGGDAVWDLMYIDGSPVWYGGPHYFLKHKKTGRILDITRDQYSVNKEEIPYEKGEKVPLVFDQDAN